MQGKPWGAQVGWYQRPPWLTGLWAPWILSMERIRVSFSPTHRAGSHNWSSLTLPVEDLLCEVREMQIMSLPDRSGFTVGGDCPPPSIPKPLCIRITKRLGPAQRHSTTSPGSPPLLGRSSFSRLPGTTIQRVTEQLVLPRATRLFHLVVGLGGATLSPAAASWAVSYCWLRK